MPSALDLVIFQAGLILGLTFGIIMLWYATKKRRW